MIHGKRKFIMGERSLEISSKDREGPRLQALERRTLLVFLGMGIRGGYPSPAMFRGDSDFYFICNFVLQC